MLLDQAIDGVANAEIIIDRPACIIMHNSVIMLCLHNITYHYQWFKAYIFLSAVESYEQLLKKYKKSQVSMKAGSSKKSIQTKSETSYFSVRHGRF